MCVYLLLFGECDTKCLLVLTVVISPSVATSSGFHFFRFSTSRVFCAIPLQTRNKMNEQRESVTPSPRKNKKRGPAAALLLLSTGKRKGVGSKQTRPAADTLDDNKRIGATKCTHRAGLPPNVNASSLCIFQPFLSFCLSSFFFFPRMKQKGHRRIRSSR